MQNKMIYKSIPHVNKPVSQIVYGTAIEPMMRGENAFELLDEVYDAGINTFDTAALYDDSEASLGNWIASRNLRDKVVVLSKGANPNKWRKRLTEYDIMSDIETSFAKLKTDYIDIYLLHRDDPYVPVGPIVELLNKLHNKGRIGAFGGSNWTVKRIEEANQYAQEHSLIPFSISSPCFGLAEQIGDLWGGSVTIAGEKNKESREWYIRNQMPTFAYSSLARGFFSGRIKSNEISKAKEILGITAEEYAFPENFEKLRRAEILADKKRVSVTQIAFAWINKQPLNVFPITSSSSIQNIHKSIYAMHMDLSEQEIRWLNLESESLEF
jgi:aryl-alcohol dehydrogenase-like predicted oxidoreductase